MARTSGSDAERVLVALCHSGLDTAGLQREALRVLRRLMPVDAAFFATADPDTLLFTGARSEEPLAASAPLFLANELAGTDVNTFTSLATAATHVASLDGATRHSRPSSERYRAIMRPIGLGDELRAALVAGTECWGYLCLHREDGELGFSRREAQLVARLGPHLAQGLRRASLPDPGDATVLPELRSGVVLLSDDLSLVAATPEAEHLMSLIGRGPGTVPLPVAVWSAAAALLALERGHGPPARLPRATVRARTGQWLTAHASRLQGPAGDDRITVVLEPARPATAATAVLSAHGLTTREIEVARLVLRGEAARAIARELRISVHTVQDHTKAIFDKTGVRSRGELAGRLLASSGPR